MGSATAVLLLGAALLLVNPGCTDPPQGLQEKTVGESIAVEVNSKAPAFAAKTLAGDRVRLADYVGQRVVLLEFWSIFCKSCIEEMPHIEDLHHRYAADGLTVLSINTDVFSSAKVASFLEKMGIRPDYPIVRDPRQEVVAAFQVELLPVTVIIDREGWIRLYQEGYRPGDEDRFERVVRRLLGRSEAEDVTLAPRDGVTAFAPSGMELAEAGRRVGPLSMATVEGELAVVGPGRPHLLFFWSLYCNPCRAEFPELERLAARYREEGLATYAVNVDSARLGQRVGRFAKRHPGLPCLLEDGAQGAAGLAPSLGVRVTPTVVLLDSQGSVAHAQTGSADMQVLDAKIREVLGQR